MLTAQTPKNTNISCTLALYYSIPKQRTKVTDDDDDYDHDDDDYDHDDGDV